MKKIKFLSIFPAFLLLGLSTTFSNNFANITDAEPVFAEEEPVIPADDGEQTLQCVVTVDKYINRSTEKVETLATYNIYPNTDYTALNNALKANYALINNKEHYSLTTISFKDNCNPDLTLLKTEALLIELNGYAWRLPSIRSWYITHDFTIKGGSPDHMGLIGASKNGGSGIFYVDHVAIKVKAENTIFADFKTGRYPLFEIVSGIVPDTVDESVKLRTTCDFTHCRFDYCSSSRYGGCLYAYRTDYIKFNNCEFKACSSKYGGALYFEDLENGQNINFNVNVFTNLKVDSVEADYGGFLYIDKNSSASKEYDIIIRFAGNCVAEYCRARYDGAFAYIDAPYINIGCHIGGSIKASGRADRYGGGIYINRNNVSLYDVELYDCIAQYGGGLYINGKNAYLSQLKFKYCTATKKGDAIYSEYPYKKYGLLTYLDDNEQPINEDYVVYFAYDEIEEKPKDLSIPIWVMGSLVTLTLIGCTVTICLVFRKKKTQ